jgi:hypothetical protein
MSFSTPSERLIPVLHTIETATAITYSLYPALKDKDVEYIYTVFHTYFKGEVQGRELPEPDSSSKVKSGMIDLIFQLLEQGEESETFNDLIDGSYAPAGRPVSRVEELYVMAFNYLRKSVRLWRHKDGERGYLRGPIRDLGTVSIEDVEE